MFKQRKNKRFNYTNKYSKGDNSKLETNLTTSKKEKLTSKWESMRSANTDKIGLKLPIKALVLLLALLLICMYLLDKKMK